MGSLIVIKRSPVVIIKNLILLQFLITSAYFIAAVLGNYQQIYQEFSFPQIFSYEVVKYAFISIVELVLVVAIFLRWFSHTYTIYPTALVTEWGIFFKKNKTIPLTPTTSLSLRIGTLSKMFKYGTLLIQNDGMKKPFIMRHIPNARMYLKLITEQTGKKQDDSFEEIGDMEEVLKKREHEKLEFKTSFRWDMNERRINKVIEKSAMKTINAFLNSAGGHLVIGVDDKGNVVGLASDYTTLKRPSSDGFEIHFTNVFNDLIGPEFRRFVRLSFPTIEGKEICHIRVLPSAKPAYMRFENEESFYIRTGNSTTALQISEVTPYIQSRWRES